MTKLYHADVFMPKRVKNSLPFGVRKLRYTRHAENASRNDRYGDLPILSTVNLDTAYIFEAEEADKGNVTKVVCRMQLDGERDIVMACIPEQGGMLVKTVWGQRRDDEHKTLDRSKYVKN